MSHHLNKSHTRTDEVGKEQNDEGKIHKTLKAMFGKSE